MRSFSHLIYTCIFAVLLTATTGCTGGKTAAYKPTGVSLSMMKLLTGSWEAVGLTVNNKTVALPANSSNELWFKNDKMMLSALGKKETSLYSVKDKMIINPLKPTERPMKIVSINRNELNLTFTAMDGQVVDMTFLRKN
jgi:hypothetical protein